MDRYYWRLVEARELTDLLDDYHLDLPGICDSTFSRAVVTGRYTGDIERQSRLRSNDYAIHDYEERFGLGRRRRHSSDYTVRPSRTILSSSHSSRFDRYPSMRQSPSSSYGLNDNNNSNYYNRYHYRWPNYLGGIPYYDFYRSTEHHSRNYRSSDNVSSDHRSSDNYHSSNYTSDIYRTSDYLSSISSSSTDTDTDYDDDDDNSNNTNNNHDDNNTNNNNHDNSNNNEDDNNNNNNNNNDDNNNTNNNNDDDNNNTNNHVNSNNNDEMNVNEGNGLALPLHASSVSAVKCQQAQPGHAAATTSDNPAEQTTTTGGTTELGCAICSEAFAKLQQRMSCVALVGCNHVFCKGCIDQVLKGQHPTYPKCHQPLIRQPYYRIVYLFLFFFWRFWEFMMHMRD